MSHSPKDSSEKNLKIISGGGSPNSERRKRVRLNLMTLEQFKLDEDGKVYLVSDLSEDGMALKIIDPQDHIHFSVGREISGNLNLRRHKYAVSAVVRHVGSESIGCEFCSETPKETLSALQKFLDPRHLGEDLREVEDTASAQGSDLWYHGPSGTDLLIWMGEGRLLRKAILYLYGIFVQIDSDGVHTGRTFLPGEHSEPLGGVSVEEIKTVEDRDIDMGKIEIARKLIDTSQIPEDLKKQALRILTPS